MVISNGQRWRERDTLKAIVIVDAAYGQGPRWKYEGEQTCWHCDILDFYLWHRFELIR